MNKDIIFESEYQKIENVMNDEILDCHIRASKKMLRYYNQLLANYNLSNHEIIISSGMGSASLMIRNKRKNITKYLFEFNRSIYYNPHILSLLDNTEESLNYIWADYIHNAILNK